MAENCKYVNEERNETYYLLDNKLYYSEQEFEQALMKKYNLNYVHQHDIMKDKACREMSREEFANELRMFLGKDDLNRFMAVGILVKKAPVSRSTRRKK